MMYSRALQWWLFSTEQHPPEDERARGETEAEKVQFERESTGINKRLMFFGLN